MAEIPEKLISHPSTRSPLIGLSDSPPNIPELTIADAVAGNSVIEDPSSRIQIWREKSGEISGYCHESDGYHWIHCTGVAGYRFDRKAYTVCAFPEPDLDPYVVQDIYQRSILPIIQHLLGREALHASAVRSPGGILGLCGNSMAGKSTIAYGLSQRSYFLWSDDSLVLEISEHAIQAVAFPFRLHLRPASASFFGSDAAQFTTRSAGCESDPAQLSREPVSALFILEQRSNAHDGPEVAVSRYSPEGALTGLLRHAYCFSLKDQRRKRLMMTNYLTLAAWVPVYAVRFAPGLERVPEILDRIELAVRSNRTS